MADYQLLAAAPPIVLDANAFDIPPSGDQAISQVVTWACGDKYLAVGQTCPVTLRSASRPDIGPYWEALRIKPKIIMSTGFKVAIGVGVLAILGAGLGTGYALGRRRRVAA